MPKAAVLEQRTAQPAAPALEQQFNPMMRIIGASPLAHDIQRGAREVGCRVGSTTSRRNGCGQLPFLPESGPAVLQNWHAEHTGATAAIIVIISNAV